MKKIFIISIGIFISFIAKSQDLSYDNCKEIIYYNNSPIEIHKAVLNLFDLEENQLITDANLLKRVLMVNLNYIVKEDGIVNSKELSKLLEIGNGIIYNPDKSNIFYNYKYLK